jgi:hypothetical protein
MRVMVLVKANEDSERGDYAGHAEEFAAMGKYNEELLKAGIMLAGEGLTPSSEGKRVDFGEDGAARVIDGPFAEAKELVGGFWIWQVSSMDEAVEWLKRSPFKAARPVSRASLDPCCARGARRRRRATDGRGGLADRIGTTHRRARPANRRRRPRRGPSSRRPGRRPRAVAGDRGA